jgi:hypothetical protein
VVVVPDADPPVLGRNERRAQHQAADDCGRQRVQALGLPPDRSPLGRQDIVRRPSQRPAEIDKHVEAEQQEPDHRSRAVKPAGDLERLAVKKAHRDTAAEQNDGRHDEERREHTHGRLRRPVRHVGAAARVVPDEPPAGGRELQQDDGDESEPDEDVPRHERVHSEQNGRDLDRDRSEQKHSHRRRQALVSVRVQSPPHLSGTVIGPGTRR